jgi:hypothetical protein
VWRADLSLADGKDGNVMVSAADRIVYASKESELKKESEGYSEVEEK